MKPQKGYFPYCDSIIAHQNFKIYTTAHSFKIKVTIQTPAKSGNS